MEPLHTAVFNQSPAKPVCEHSKATLSPEKPATFIKTCSNRLQHFSDSPPSPHTGDILTEFLKLGSTKESTEEILGRGLMEEEGKGQESSSLRVVPSET